MFPRGGKLVDIELITDGRERVGREGRKVELNFQPPRQGLLLLSAAA